MRRIRSARGEEYDLAMQIIEDIGDGNLIYKNNNFYLWQQDRGVWEKLPSDYKLRKKIIGLIDFRTVGSTFPSVIEIIKVQTADDEICFNQFRLLNCLNGEVHFIEGKISLLPHSRESYSTIQLKVNYDPDAKAPRFEQFLKEIFDCDEDKEEKAQFLLEFMGYAFDTTCEREKMLILVGNGANGKSTILDLIQNICGEENTAAVQPTDLNCKFQRAFLEDKLINIVPELDVGKRLPEGKLKAIISGDKSTVEEKYKGPHNIRPFATCLIGTNHLPPTKDFSEGFFRKAEILEFNRQFRPDERDVNLKQKLWSEKDGIFVMAVKAYINVLVSNQFTRVPSSAVAIEDWRNEGDQVRRFASEKLVADKNSELVSSDLYKIYLSWSQSTSSKNCLSHLNFSRRMFAIGATPRRTALKRYIRGFREKTDDDERKMQKQEQILEEKERASLRRILF